MINVKNLHYAYAASEPVFSDLSFQINSGEAWGILGRNGSGKSTLMDLLLGIRRPEKGSISINGFDLSSNIEEAGREISYVSQEIGLPNSIRISEFLHFHSLMYPRYSKEKEAEYLSYFKVNPKKLIGSLSLGQQKKLQFIAAFSSGTKILLVDEITAVLDAESRLMFFKVLRDIITRERKTVFLATNIAEDLHQFASHVIFLDHDTVRIVNPSEIGTLFNAA